MIANPLPGTSLSQLIELLRREQTELINLQGQIAGQPGHERYVRWATEATARLRGRVTEASLERLVQSRGYWALFEQSYYGGTQPVVDLRNEEVQARRGVVDAALAEAKAAAERWSRPGRWVVADTSFYMNYPQRLDELVVEGDLASRLKVWEEPIRLVVPILVVDEMDNLKWA